MFQNTPLYQQLVALPYLSAYQELVTGAMELDVFSQIETPTTAQDLATKMGWHVDNTLHMLRALHSLGFVEWDDGRFYNSPDASRYLVRDKPEYMGSVLLFFCGNQGMSLARMTEMVQNGPMVMEQTQQSLDFAAYGQAMRQAQSGIRQQELKDLVHTLPESAQIRKILDLGCGAGMLGLSLIAENPERSGVLFDQPAMRPLIEESVAQQQMQERATVLTGNFLTDDIGSGYDLILCSSIMLFALPGGADFFSKLRKALAPGGLVLCINEGIAPDYAGPWDMILGYLTYNMQGMPMGVIQGQLAEVARAGGFSRIENRTLLLSTGTHDIHILRV